MPGGSPAKSPLISRSVAEVRSSRSLGVSAAGAADSDCALAAFGARHSAAKATIARTSKHITDRRERMSDIVSHRTAATSKNLAAAFRVLELAFSLRHLDLAEATRIHGGGNGSAA